MLPPVWVQVMPLPGHHCSTAGPLSTSGQEAHAVQMVMLNSDHLVKVVPSRFLHYKITISPL